MWQVNFFYNFKYIKPSWEFFRNIFFCYFEGLKIIFVRRVSSVKKNRLRENFKKLGKKKSKKKSQLTSFAKLGLEETVSSDFFSDYFLTHFLKFSRRKMRISGIMHPLVAFFCTVTQCMTPLISSFGLRSIFWQLGFFWVGFLKPYLLIFTFFQFQSF